LCGETLLICTISAIGLEVCQTVLRISHKNFLVIIKIVYKNGLSRIGNLYSIAWHALNLHLPNSQWLTVQMKKGYLEKQ